MYAIPRMRSIHNSVSDVVNELGLADQVEDRVYHLPNRWIVRFTSKPGAMVFFALEAEVLQYENENEPTICVLHRVGMSRRTMERIMDTLENALREAPPLQPVQPPAGEPRWG
jgi:hypothetical protein